MAVDPYASCPCGSGKKIKFCCQDVVADMQKVAKIRGNQPRRAVQILEGLEDAHPSNIWVASSHARLLMELDDYAAARDRCERFLDANEEPPTEIIAVLALAAFVADGYESSKRTIHRAFQLCGRREPALLSRLAAAISLVMLEAESFMSARAHAALAVKLAPQERRSDCVMQLAQIEGNQRIPYPLRSVHRLTSYTAAVEDANVVNRALRLSGVGCWEPAAILFARVAEKHPEAAELWHNIGLCQAWDGNEVAAAEALHKAAGLYQDLEAAVECETLAQLLDMELTDDVNEIVSRPYAVTSVSRLLTVLDEQDRLERLTLEGEQAETAVAQYRVLERTFPTDVAPSEMTIDKIPEFIADAVIFDAIEDRPAIVQITGIEGESLDDAVKLVEAAAGDLIDTLEGAEPEVLGVVPRELEGLEWNCHFPQDFPATVARDLETAKMRSVSEDVWPELPLSGLEGKTPREAAEDAALAVRLHAAVLVLDAFYDRNNVMLDIDAVRERLGLSAPAPLQAADTNLTGLSTVALQRLPLAELSDEQLVEVARRVMLVRHSRTAYHVLTAVAEREACVEKVDPERVYSGLVGICREQNRREEAFRWLALGRENAGRAPESFRAVLEWDIREFNLRLDDPEDPVIPELWRKFEDHYFVKLPELRDGMVMYLIEQGMGHLASEPRVAAAVSEESEGGVWTPESESSGGSGKKLWVPGQD